MIWIITFMVSKMEDLILGNHIIIHLMFDSHLIEHFFDLNTSFHSKLS